MKPTTPPDDELRDPLLARVRRLEPTEAAVARAWQRLRAGQARPAHSRRRPWFVLAATSSMAMLAVFVWWRAHPPVAVAPAVVAPVLFANAPAAAELVAVSNADVQASLLGPGRVSVERGSITLQAGVLIGTAVRPLVIKARDVEVRVPAHAVFEVRIVSTGVTVAAWQGDLAVVRGHNRVEEVRAGTRSDGAGIEPLSRAMPAPTTPSTAASPLAMAAPRAFAPQPTAAPRVPARTTTAPAVTSTSPAPASAPEAKSTPPTATSAPSSAAENSESSHLQRAIRELRRVHDPKASLALLDTYDMTFPNGALRSEARLVRVDALLALGEKSLALRELDAIDELPRAELRLARAELRAHAGRHRDALTDLVAIDAPPFSRDHDKGERLVWALAVCHAALGDVPAKNLALQRYLDEFPGGPHVAAAKAGLRP